MRIVREHAPNALIEDVMTLAEYKSQSVAPQRLNAMLISSFGALAVIIAAVGIAGVLAFSVSARTNEIGIRMSLGADRLGSCGAGVADRPRNRHARVSGLWVAAWKRHHSSYSVNAEQVAALATPLGTANR